MFEMVSNFTVHPTKWLIIVDGANDGSELEIERCAGIYGINVQCFILPPKEKGSLRTLGKAYNAAFDGLDLRSESYDFMCVMDVDNTFHPRYIESVLDVFESPRIGVVSGYSPEAPKLKMPQGNGKCVRWDVVQYITEFWEPAIDTMLNIKAKKLGYRWYILDDVYGYIGGPSAARNRTAAGSKHAGWFWFYTSGSMWEAFKRMVYRILKCRNGIAFMRGFLEGRRIGEQSMDQDVIEFYGRKDK